MEAEIKKKNDVKNYISKILIKLSHDHQLVQLIKAEMMLLIR